MNKKRIIKHLLFSQCLVMFFVMLSVFYFIYINNKTLKNNTIARLEALDNEIISYLLDGDFAKTRSLLYILMTNGISGIQLVNHFKYESEIFVGDLMPIGISRNIYLSHEIKAYGNLIANIEVYSDMKAIVIQTIKSFLPVALIINILILGIVIFSQAPLFSWNKKVLHVIKRLNHYDGSPMMKKNLISEANSTSVLEINKITIKLIELIERLTQSLKRESENKRFVEIGQSTSHIAHDMRSPLTVLKTFIQYAKCGVDDDSLELESAAKNSVKRLNDMADELLDYSKATKIEKTKINIDNLINDSVKSAKVNAEKKGVNIIYTNELDISEINADSYRIGRVMTNIINNSIQAMDVLPCDMRDATCVNKVNITTYIDEKNLVIKVRDNGKGIKEDDLPKIFDAFFTAGKKGGTGLGLSYCKQVVEAHGGEITVESEVGKGAEFKIAIPV